MVGLHPAVTRLVLHRNHSREPYGMLRSNPVQLYTKQLSTYHFIIAPALQIPFLGTGLCRPKDATRNSWSSVPAVQMQQPKETLLLKPCSAKNYLGHPEVLLLGM